jgi:hypothetical protein
MKVLLKRRGRKTEHCRIEKQDFGFQEKVLTAQDEHWYEEVGKCFHIRN